MPNTTVYTNNQYYQDIAAAIRNKNGQSTLYKPSEMAPAINALVVSGQSINLQNKTVNPTTSQQSVKADSGYTGLNTVTVNAIQTQSKTVTVNGTVTPDSGKFLSSVIVNVPTGSNINNQDKTIDPTKERQYVTADTGYTGLGQVIVEPIASEYIIPSGSTTLTTNGTHNIAQYAQVNVNVPSSGTTINNQNKSVTPTKSQQSITADSGYTGLGTVTVNAIPAAYITTSDADAIAANILLNKTAYVNGSKITGSMANNGATGGIITEQGGIYTIPAGYTSGGTVSANITASTITNTALNVASFEEMTGDYGVRASITIPAGYYSQTTLTKDLSTVLPAPDTAIAENQMLAGYQAYNNEGELLTGTMTNNAAWSRTLDQTTTSVTIPAGYHSGTGTVSHTTVNIPDPTITVSAAGLITASGSWTRGFTTDNSYSKTQQLTTQAAKTVTPTESEQNAVAAGVYTTGIVKVGAISSTYVGSGVTKKAAATITPSTSNQTIATGTYLTGTQTIAGDADLVAGNIKSGVNIFGVNGTFTSDADATASQIVAGATAYVDGDLITGELVVNKYYTGATAPAAALGNNGDIYLQQ